MAERDPDLHEFKPTWTIRPGVALAEVLDDRKLTPEEAAAVTGLTVETITGIRDGTTRIDQQIAERLEAGLGVSARFWLGYQASYDAGIARGAEDISQDYEDDFPWAPGKTPIITKTGRVLTDGDISALADEAERGYDLPGGADA